MAGDGVSAIGFVLDIFGSWDKAVRTQAGLEKAAREGYAEVVRLLEDLNTKWKAALQAGAQEEEDARQAFQDAAAAYKDALERAGIDYDRGMRDANEMLRQIQVMQRELDDEIVDRRYEAAKTMEFMRLKDILSGVRGQSVVLAEGQARSELNDEIADFIRGAREDIRTRQYSESETRRRAQEDMALAAKGAYDAMRRAERDFEDARERVAQEMATGRALYENDKERLNEQAKEYMDVLNKRKNNLGLWDETMISMFTLGIAGMSEEIGDAADSLAFDSWFSRNYGTTQVPA